MTTVIVTSVLNPISKPLDYSSIRSVYSPEQRVEQSINTIFSVRKNLGDVRILFVDCSVSPPTEASKIKDILRNDDRYIDLSNQSSVSIFVNSANKSYGELMLLDWAISNISFKDDIFKISGRYYLENEFDFGTLDRNADINCKARGFKHANNVCLTTFYRIKTQDTFKKYIEHGKLLFQQYPTISAEHVLFNFLACNQNLKIQNLDRIGVVGNIAVTGDIHYN